MMRRYASAVTVFILLLMLSCRSDVPSVEMTGDGNLHYTQDFSGTIATASVRSGMKTRALVDIEEYVPNSTVLVHYDGNGDISPLVFRNDAGEHVVFSVTRSIPLADTFFAIETDEMYVMSGEPGLSFIEKTDPVTLESVKYPVFDEVGDMKTYRFRDGHGDAQVIVDTLSGHAVFLEDMDFSAFKSIGPGIYSRVRGRTSKYLLDEAQTNGRFLYIRNNRNEAYEIDMDRPEKARAIGYLNSGIRFADDRVVLGEYMVLDIAGQALPRNLGEIEIPRMLKSDDGSTLLLYDSFLHTGNMCGIDGELWSICSAKEIEYILDGDGRRTRSAIADGFHIGNEWVDISGTWADDFKDDCIRLTGFSLAPDENGNCYALKDRMKYPVTDRSGRPIPFESGGITPDGYRFIYESGNRYLVAFRISFDYMLEPVVGKVIELDAGSQDIYPKLINIHGTGDDGCYSVSFRFSDGIHGGTIDFGEGKVISPVRYMCDYPWKLQSHENDLIMSADGSMAAWLESDRINGSSLSVMDYDRYVFQSLSLGDVRIKWYSLAFRNGRLYFRMYPDFLTEGLFSADPRDLSAELRTESFEPVEIIELVKVDML